MNSVDEPPVGINSTFRDPQGRLHLEGERVLREIYEGHAESVLAWIRSPLAQRWMAEGRLVATTILDAPPLKCGDGSNRWLEHERIFFPSYPWEWTPGQWRAAGELTLDLCEEALGSGLLLKDATPLNVLFAGPSPVFVDVLSFEPRDKSSPVWLAYGQFVRTYLLPLAAYACLGWPLSFSQQRRDGYEPAEIAPWLGWVSRWRAPMRALVTAPLLLEKRLAKTHGNLSYRPRFSEDLAEQTLRRSIQKARKTLAGLKDPEFSSRWSEYPETAIHYTEADRQGKETFVRRTLSQIRPAHVLDIGANTGFYSRIAAECGADVVAWDKDVRAVDRNRKEALQKKLAILPLVADFARPTPAVGWRNQECMALLDRARQRFDCVLMLGLLHHLLVADQIPLDSILGQVAEISRRWAILEWIPKQDVQFISLCRGREDLYKECDDEYFERALMKRFHVCERERLPNGRTLYLMERMS